jgi:hypothetical protein
MVEGVLGLIKIILVFRLNLAAAGEKACYASFFTCGGFGTGG